MTATTDTTPQGGLNAAMATAEAIRSTILQSLAADAAVATASQFLCNAARDAMASGVVEDFEQFQAFVLNSVEGANADGTKYIPANVNQLRAISPSLAGNLALLGYVWDKRGNAPSDTCPLWARLTKGEPLSRLKTEIEKAHLKAAQEAARDAARELAKQQLAKEQAEALAAKEAAEARAAEVKARWEAMTPEEQAASKEAEAAEAAQAAEAEAAEAAAKVAAEKARDYRAECRAHVEALTGLLMAHPEAAENQAWDLMARTLADALAACAMKAQAKAEAAARKEERRQRRAA